VKQEIHGDVARLWNVKLKDGRTVVVRFFVLEDKEKLAEMFASMSSQALRWGMPPYTTEIIDRWMNNLPNLIPLVAADNDRIVGWATIYKYSHPRRKGVCDLGMYLHQDFHNVGLGTAMLSRLLELAQKEKLHRISLTVIADNSIAVHLYEKFGFKTEGITKDAYFGDDAKYHDEIVMGLVSTRS
jgi:putative acetyltransferase